MATRRPGDLVDEAYLAWRDVKPRDGTLAAGFYGVVDALFLRWFELPQSRVLTMQCLQNVLLDAVRCLLQDGVGRSLASAALDVLHARLWDAQPGDVPIVIKVILTVSFALHQQPERILQMAPIARWRGDICIRDIINSWSPETL